MPVLKAFHMVLRLNAKKKGCSLWSWKPRVVNNKMTGWLFKRILQLVMKKIKKKNLGEKYMFTKLLLVAILLPIQGEIY